MHPSTRYFGALTLAAAFLTAPAWSQAVGGWNQSFMDPAGSVLGSFGREVLIQGDNMLITANGANNQGAVFALRRIGGVWTPKQKFTGSTTAQGDFFGMTAALDGNQAVVGATQDDDLGFNSGSVFLYEYNGTNWVETAQIFAPDGDSSDKFGSAVALSGDLLVVGASADELGLINNVGSIYVFRKVAGVWGFEQKVLGSSAAAGAEFGWDVQTDGTTILASALGESNGLNTTGAVYAFSFDGLNWNEDQRFFPSVGGDGDWFGWSMNLEGERVAIGAPQHTGGGAVYVFERQGGAWTELDKVVSASTVSGDALGWSVDLQWPVLVAGAPGAVGIPTSPAGASDGAVYKFNFTGAEWVDVQHWVSGDVNVTSFPPPQMGMSVALDGKTVISGAPFANTTAASNAGRVYRFDSKAIGFQILTPTVIAGQNAQLGIWGGIPGQPYGLALTGINGVPYPVFLVSQGVLGLDGSVILNVPSPVAFVGLNLTLLGGAIWQPGQIGISAEQTIQIQ